MAADRELAQRHDSTRGQSGSVPARGGRVPPHNLQAEESVLGALLLSRDAIGVVSDRYSFAPVLVVASLAPLLAIVAVLTLVRNTSASGDDLLRKV